MYYWALLAIQISSVIAGNIFCGAYQFFWRAKFPVQLFYIFVFNRLCEIKFVSLVGDLMSIRWCLYGALFGGRKLGITDLLLAKDFSSLQSPQFEKQKPSARPQRTHSNQRTFLDTWKLPVFDSLRSGVNFVLLSPSSNISKKESVFYHANALFKVSVFVSTKPNQIFSPTLVLSICFSLKQLLVLWILFCNRFRKSTFSSAREF